MSGRFTARDATLEGTALVGRDSMVFLGTLRTLVESEGQPSREARRSAAG